MSKTQQAPVRPSNGRILVNVPKREEKTAGGLYIPPTANNDGQTQRGKVIALGAAPRSKDGEQRQWEVKNGETVLFSAYAGTKLQFDGEDFIMLQEEDVLGILN